MMHLPRGDGLQSKWNSVRFGSRPVAGSGSMDACEPRKASPQSSRSRGLHAGAAKLSASAPHVAFALAFGPGQHVFHLIALIVLQAHFGLHGLGVDLLSNLGRRRRRCDRQNLMVVWIGIAEQRSLWRTFLGPRFERRQLGEGGQVV